jgi:hypothetical protein
LLRLDFKDVFVDCPFDDSYKPIFQAILFAVCDLGFVARCALEADDGSEVRLEKILRIVGLCARALNRQQLAEIQYAA